MSCNYCDESKHYLLSEEVVLPNAMMGEAKFKDIDEEPIFVFIDRGYLRLCSVDSSCMDHGEKIKINFCPVCGKWLTNPAEEEKQ